MSSLILEEGLPNQRTLLKGAASVLALQTKSLHPVT